MKFCPVGTVTSIGCTLLSLRRSFFRSDLLQETDNPVNMQGRKHDLKLSNKPVKVIRFFELKIFWNNILQQHQQYFLRNYECYGTENAKIFSANDFFI
jgi:hypothetical protein